MSDLTLFEHVELVALDSIYPYVDNPKEHPDEQVDKIASSIKNFGWDQPIVIDGDGEIIKGHGRYQAAKQLGLDEVPVIRQTDLTDAEVRAARLADNRVAESAWDDELLATELDVLDDFDLDLDITGFDEDELDDLLETPGAEDEDDIYTDKIESPVYEPTGPEPPLADCYDAERFEELRERVAEADIPEDVRQFFHLAAHRHIVFDYENIAEWYAHQDPEVQAVAEALTLVIIDYDQAIEQGFIDFAEDTLDGVGGDDGGPADD